jgi:hypothetical protein
MNLPAKMTLAVAFFLGLNSASSFGYGDDSKSHNDSSRHRTHGHSKSHSSEDNPSKPSEEKSQAKPPSKATKRIAIGTYSKLGSEKPKPIGNNKQ